MGRRRGRTLSDAALCRARWQPAGEPAHQPHEYQRAGTAKLLTLFHPADGQVRVTGVTSCTNAVLHGWLKAELVAILAELPAPTPMLSREENRAVWAAWQAGLTGCPILPADPPPLRMLLVLDNLAGHQTPDFVRWLFAAWHHAITRVWRRYLAGGTKVLFPTKN